MNTDFQIYKLNEYSFDDIALDIFSFQARNNPIYRQYIQNLGVNVSTVDSIYKIPFMPISFFKNHAVQTLAWEAEIFFTSSGTTGAVTSKHLIKDLRFYLEHAERCFNHFFGDLKNYHFLGYLPSYLERSNSSLIAMIDHFIKRSESQYSGFYLTDTDKLIRDVKKLKYDSRKTIVWGVAFALLDLSEKYPVDLSHCLVFETGGMKGRRKEITRQSLHNQLNNALNTNVIYSEYGMTELLSQAYSTGEFFKCPPWIKILTREITDPLNTTLVNENGAINVIDLANVNTISFIETEDIGKLYSDGSFEVLGRLDNSDVRGCNLLV